MAKNIKSDEWQSNIIIGIALIIVGVIIAFFALSQPRIEADETAVNASQQSQQSSMAAQTEIQSSVTMNSGRTLVYPLDLNTCTKAELMTIKGIGEAKAQAIIAYREHIGGYTTPEELKNISGIGDAFYEKIAPYVTVK